MLISNSPENKINICGINIYCPPLKKKFHWLSPFKHQLKNCGDIYLKKTSPKQAYRIVFFLGIFKKSSTSWITIYIYPLSLSLHFFYIRLSLFPVLSPFLHFLLLQDDCRWSDSVLITLSVALPLFNQHRDHEHYNSTKPAGNSLHCKRTYTE